MIGVDTNILVRYFASDDPAQFRKADDFITQSKNRGVQLYVDDFVLCELVWVGGSMSMRDAKRPAHSIAHCAMTSRSAFSPDPTPQIPPHRVHPSLKGARMQPTPPKVAERITSVLIRSSRRSAISR